MGKFHYNATTRTDIDDRLLLHLQIVIGTKLRRGEGFPFTWKDDARMGSGRTTVWLSASSTIIYRYHGSRMPSVNSQWLEALMLAANSPAGLYAVNEPAAGTRRDTIAPDELLPLELVP
jgi:hypothetical protein